MTALVATSSGAGFTSYVPSNGGFMTFYTQPTVPPEKPMTPDEVQFHQKVIAHPPVDLKTLKAVLLDGTCFYYGEPFPKALIRLIAEFAGDLFCPRLINEIPPQAKWPNNHSIMQLILTHQFPERERTEAIQMCIDAGGDIHRPAANDLCTHLTLREHGFVHADQPVARYLSQFKFYDLKRLHVLCDLLYMNDACSIVYRTHPNHLSLDFLAEWRPKPGQIFAKHTLNELITHCIKEFALTNILLMLPTTKSLSPNLEVIHFCIDVHLYKPAIKHIIKKFFKDSLNDPLISPVSQSRPHLQLHCPKTENKESKDVIIEFSLYMPHMKYARMLIPEVVYPSLTEELQNAVKSCTIA